MQDSPAPEALIAEVRALLEIGASRGFEQRVAANALGIALRDLTSGRSAADHEHQRLQRLFGEAGDLSALNARLAGAIRLGAIDSADPPLLDHLIRTTLEKIAVDQPTYPAYCTWRQAGARPSRNEGTDNGQ